jgi:4'-phosphopantetheinyl transferase EntD
LQSWYFPSEKPDVLLICAGAALDASIAIINCSEGPLSLLSQILPPRITIGEQIGTLAGSILPEEEGVVGANALPKRRQEFAAGRTCAREALGLIGLSETSILCDLNREPLWPAGVVGSITHCNGYAAAAVAYSTDFVTIGIDAEPNEPLPNDVLEFISLDAERKWLSQMAEPGICWDRLLFSIKESIYKAWYPATKMWLDFDQAYVTIHSGNGTFSIELLINPAIIPKQFLSFSGRYCVIDSLILTSMCVPNST